MSGLNAIVCSLMLLTGIAANAQFTIAKSSVTCYGQCNATAQISPGTGYRYRWSNGDSTSYVNNLCAGSYTITISDTNGVHLDTLQTTITQPVQLTINTITESTSCTGAYNGGLIVTATGGSPPYNFTADKPNVTGFSNTDGNFTHLDSGLYVTSVTDNNECVRRDTTFLGVLSSACAGINQVAGLSSFSIQPNPISNSAKLVYELSKPVPVTIGIYSCTGKKIMQLINEPQGTGQHTQSLNIASLAAGNYILSFSSDTGSFNTALVKQ